MPDPRMLNGGKKGTAIVRFDHTAMMVVNGEKKEFKNIEKMKEFKERKKIETNIEHIFPTSIRSEHRREWNIPFQREESIGEGPIKSAIKILLTNLKFIFKSG